MRPTIHALCAKVHTAASWWVMEERQDEQDRAQRCPRCGGELALMTRLPALAPHPAYWIYRCFSCGIIEWIAEKMKPAR
jgi:DNA-directed RNA polymerase subunit RPC12/RpoP